MVRQATAVFLQRHDFVQRLVGEAVARLDDGAVAVAHSHQAQGQAILDGVQAAVFQYLV